MAVLFVKAARADIARASRSAFTPTTGPATALVAALGAGALGAAAVLDPASVEHGPVICPFRLATGLPCPGCGMVRSWVFLTHGRWHEAFTANPFGLVAALFVAVVAVVAGLAVVRRRPIPMLGELLRGRHAGPVVAAVVGGWLVFGVVRIVVAVFQHALS
jgi:Protein of unknown function (DUF2752)